MIASPVVKEVHPTLKAAVIGAGIAGGELARQMATRADVRLVAAVDVSREAATRFCGAHGGNAYTDVTDMVTRERPDFIVVASSNHAHADNVIESINAGVRNVYCEKPIAIEVDDAARMVDAARRHGVRTSLGFAGLEAGTRRVLELIDSGKLGRVMHVYYHTHRGYGFWGQERVNYRGTRCHHSAVMHPEHSGGWLVHHACHMVFVLSRIAGPVSAVFGQLQSSTDEAPSEELINASLRFANGASGTVLDSIGSFRGMRMGVIGTRGTVALTDDMAKRPGAAAEIRWRGESEDTDRVETFSFESHRQTRLLEFIDAIQQGTPSPILFEEALENLQICRAIGHANATGEAVELPAYLPDLSADRAAAISV